jgi:hypothetical protein
MTEPWVYPAPAKFSRSGMLAWREKPLAVLAALVGARVRCKAHPPAALRHLAGADGEAVVELFFGLTVAAIVN